MLLEYLQNVWHCPHEIRKTFIEIDVIRMGTYFLPKPFNIYLKKHYDIAQSNDPLFLFFLHPIMLLACCPLTCSGVRCSTGHKTNHHVMFAFQFKGLKDHYIQFLFIWYTFSQFLWKMWL